MGSEDNSKDLGLWRDLLSPSQMCQKHLPDLEVLDPLVGHEILEPPKEDRKEASPSHFDSQHPSCWLSFLPSYSPNLPLVQVPLSVQGALGHHSQKHVQALPMRTEQRTRTRFSVELRWTVAQEEILCS